MTNQALLEGVGRSRITAERQINEERLAVERRKRTVWQASRYDPPPF